MHTRGLCRRAMSVRPSVWMCVASLLRIFDQYLASSRVVDGEIVSVVNRVSSDRGELVTLIGGICVQHSNETRVTVFGHL